MNALCAALAAEGFETEAAPADDEERSRRALEKEAVNAAETITRLHGFFGETVESLSSLGADIDTMRASLAKVQSVAETAKAEHEQEGTSQATSDSAQMLADVKAKCEEIERDRQRELNLVKSLAPKDPTPKVLLMEVVPIDAPDADDTSFIDAAREQMLARVAAFDAEEAKEKEAREKSTDAAARGAGEKRT